MKFLRSKKGFTIIELIVVMAVIAILVTMGVPRFLGYTRDAEVTGMKADIKILETAALQYAIQNDDALPATTTVAAITATGVVDNQGVAIPVADLDGFTLDPAKIGPFVRSTQNPIDEYFITPEFVVLHLTGVDGSDGTNWHGLSAKVPAP